MDSAVVSVMGVSWRKGAGQESLDASLAGDAQPDGPGVGRHMKRKVEERAAAPLIGDEAGSQLQRVIAGGELHGPAVGQLLRRLHPLAQLLEGGGLLLALGGGERVQVAGKAGGGGFQEQSPRGAGPRGIPLGQWPA